MPDENTYGAKPSRAERLPTEAIVSNRDADRGAIEDRTGGPTAPAETHHSLHQPGLFGEDAQLSVQPRTLPRAADPLDARAAWQKPLGELQLQLNSSTYYTWLHDTWVEGYEDGEFHVGTPNTYARDWLENRLRPLVRKTIKSIVGRNVDVKFLVRARRVTDSDRRPATALRRHRSA